jgi:glyoxylate reductase
MAAPRVLVTRRLPGPALAYLARRCRVRLHAPDRPMTRTELRRGIGKADGLLCTPVDRIDRWILRSARQLRGIANCAVGVDNLDLEEARRLGIPVSNTPGILSAATADLTWALILAVTRRVVEGDRLVRQGRFRGWSPTFHLGRSLQGKTLGILGMGRIGREVARRAAAFSMHTIYWSRTRLSRAEEARCRARYRPLRRLLAAADVLTIHLPGTPATRGLLGRRELAAMKPSAVLINTSRGEILDETALVRALRTRRLSGAGLDVYRREPKVPRSLLKLPQVVLLPHLGSATVETRQTMAMTAAVNLMAMLEGRVPPNPVMPPARR